MRQTDTSNYTISVCNKCEWSVQIKKIISFYLFPTPGAHVSLLDLFQSWPCFLSLLYLIKCHQIGCSGILWTREPSKLSFSPCDPSWQKGCGHQCTKVSHAKQEQVTVGLRSSPPLPGFGFRGHLICLTCLERRQLQRANKVVLVTFTSHYNGLSHPNPQQFTNRHPVWY